MVYSAHILADLAAQIYKNKWKLISFYTRVVCERMIISR